MKFKIFSLFFFMVMSSLVAQKQQTIKSSWVVVQDTKQVRISNRTVQLDDIKNGTHIQYVQFKYQNKTAQQLFVSFYIDAKYQINQVSNIDDEDYRAFLLEANQTFIPEFTTLSEKSHFVFKRLMNYTDKSELQSVNIVKLKTNNIK